jgi:UPF0755 protein
VTTPERARAAASRRRILLRRGAAIVLLVAVLAATGWAAVAVVGSDSGSREAEPTTLVTTAPPPPKPLRIVFPEGFTRKEMASRITAVNGIAKRRRKVTPRLSAQSYLAATRRTNLPRRFAAPKGNHAFEGFLFPATYEFTARTTSKQLVAEQLKAFRRNWETVDLRYAKKKKLTPYDVLIIASMIEKEVQVASERQLVAAVIYNRLRIGLPLGIDATLRYGLDIPPTEAIRESQLESDSPFNTRKRSGLPPTPIANPGLASLHAAARPARKNYLYFIRRPDCKSHFFTASAREFDNYTRAGLQC